MYCLRPHARLGKILAIIVFVSSPAMAMNHVVIIGGNEGSNFAPSSLSIQMGDTVTFKNAGGSHNIVSEPGSPTPFRCSSTCVVHHADPDTGDPLPEDFSAGRPSDALWSQTMMFKVPGVITYHSDGRSSLRPAVTGRITVNVPSEFLLPNFEVNESP